MNRLPTGRKSDYSFLSNEARETLGTDEDGFYLYRQILHPDLPNLVFIGRTSTFINILICCLQARWLAELMTSRPIVITNWYFVGACTGRSAGRSPLRMRSTVMGCLSVLVDVIRPVRDQAVCGDEVAYTA
jgi:hypothetical protein